MDFDLDRCVGFVTDQAMKCIADAFNQRLKDSHVTRIQWIALYMVDRWGPISQRELAHKMKVKDSSAGRLIDRLERDGLVKRDQLPSDRRVLMLSLTEAGKAHFSEVLPMGIAFNESLVSGISEADLLVFERVLQQLTKNIDAK